MKTNKTTAQPAPEVGSAAGDLSDAIGLLNGRAIKEHALRMSSYSAQNLELALDALNQAVEKVRMIERKVAVAEMAMRSIRDYPCGHKPSGVGGRCEACEAMKKWDELSNAERSNLAPKI